ncbi:MAG TPA: sensor histidine kinase [Pseudonocardiaceae bacterium]|nr:sensor histidine kinase [Pseudonocardiaceae bacterium]
MSADLPLDEPARGVISDHSFFRTWQWEAYFATVGVMGVVLAWVTPVPDRADRLVATGLLLALTVWWLALGRRLYLRNAGDGAGLGYYAGVFALVVPLLVLAPNCCWVLFALTPQVFMLVRDDRVANVLATCMVLLPALVELVRFGVYADFWVSVAIGVGMAGMAMLVNVATERIAQQSAERARLIEELEAGRAEIADLSRQAGVAAERERLAAEIHDTLAQGFTSILTLVQAASAEGDRDRANGYLDLAAHTARENLGEARALVGALVPPAMLAGSLVDAVRRQATRLTEECGIRAEFEARHLGAVPMPVEVVLLRSAQEALANVRKHSGARTARISLGGTENGVLLTVADDGVGFDASADTNGFGLRGMRNRVEQVGGNLTVESGPKGTMVRVEVCR